MRITRERFGAMPDGRPVDIYTLANDRGMEVLITPYGGIIIGIRVPDRVGCIDDVVLGHDSLEPYLSGNAPYLGAIVGRYANRIAGGRFTLDGTAYTLAINNGPNHLHGGTTGFDKRLWDAEETTVATGPALRFSYTSPDGEEGYPGTLQATAVYSLSEENTLTLTLRAVADAPTIVNLANHTYFNLAGTGGGDILDHEITIAAEHYVPIDATCIPLGGTAPVAGTPFDFTTSTHICGRIDADHPQIANGMGIDHTFVLNSSGNPDKRAARVYEPGTGRVLEVFTTQPGMQFYTGNFLDGTIIGRGGTVYERRFGFCLETQHFPDSPNRPEFPSVVLRPGEEQEEITVYRFGVNNDI